MITNFKGVTVVVPHFNRPEELRRAIESIWLQDVDLPLEIIVVDDCSDLVPEINLDTGYRKSISIVVLGQRSGANIARNRGALLAKYDCLAFLDCDDTWKPQHLRKSLDVMNKSGFGFCCSSFVTVRGHRHKKLILNSLEGRTIVDYIMEGGGDTRTSTFVIAKHLFNSILFDSGVKKHQDWDFAVRASRLTGIAINTDTTVVINVGTSNRMSNSPNLDASIMFYEKFKGDFSSASKSIFWLNILFTVLSTGDFDCISQNISRITLKNLPFKHKLKYLVLRLNLALNLC